jgi:succinate dehydrogenase/fumarate reductase iron-sulfur protein
MSETLRVTIERFNPEADEHPYFKTYIIPRQEGMVIADVLQSIYENQEPDLGFFWECRTRRCGTCAVRMDGKPVLACRQLAHDGMLLKPLEGLPVVRDLIIDRLPLQERIVPWFEDSGSRSKTSRILLDPSQIAHYRALSECIDCFICESVCPAIALNHHSNPQFGGPRLLIRMEAKIQREGEPLPWLMFATAYNPSLCTRCFACTENCPRDLRPAEAIGSLTSRLYERNELDDHKIKHVGAFMRSIRTSGWLDELRLLVDIYGPIGVLKFTLQAIRLLLHGKLPWPHLQQKPQGKEIELLLNNMDKSQLPRLTFARKMNDEALETMKDKQSHS